MEGSGVLQDKKGGFSILQKIGRKSCFCCLFRRAFRVFFRSFRFFAEVFSKLIRRKSPPVRRNHFSRCSVNELPPLLRVMQEVRCDLLSEKTVHIGDFQMIGKGSHSFGHEVELLTFFHVFFGKFVVASCHKIGAVDLHRKRKGFLIQLGSVTVSYRIRSQACNQFFRFF